MRDRPRALHPRDLRLRLIAASVALVSLAAPARAEEPETRDLVLAGLAMAPVSYALGVVTHEGSHAVAGKLMGLEVSQFKVIPGRYGPARRFYFGYVRVRGKMTDRERIGFWLAPKLTDTVLVGSYAALLFSGVLPENRYGKLAFTVAATGFWVDFSKDVIAFWPGNDVVKAYDKMGLETELEKLPARLLHAALAAAGGYALARGYQDVFEDGDAAEPVVMPVWQASF